MPDPARAAGARRLEPKLRLSRIRLLVVPVFAAGMAGAYAAPWIWLGRGFTARTLTATAYIALAAALAAAAAMLAARLLARRPWSARFAASLVLLVAGTAGLASLFFAVEAAWATHPMGELPIRVALQILLIIAASALYTLLALAAPLLLPLGLPLAVLSAVLIARPPR